MKFETVKIIAAFGGLGLGVLNLGITVYKDFFRKTKLIIEIDSASIRCVNEGEYDFQVNLSLRSKNGPSYLRNIFIEHPEKCINEYDCKNIINAHRVLDYQLTDLLLNNPDDFKSKLIEKFKAPIYIRDMKIDDQETKSVTITDRIYTKREMDGNEDFPINGWSLKVSLGDKIIDKTIVWETHSNGSDGYWQRS